MLQWFRGSRLTQGLVVALVALAAVGNAMAWQTIIATFEHSNRYGGEANSGQRTGSVEYTGSERRIRAGADNIAFTQAQINWNKNTLSQTGGYPAEVFHISPKNQAGGVCNNIRIPGSGGWNWTNLPAPSITTKGCSVGQWGNEVRFYYNPNNASTGATYYIQSLYKDTGYNGTAGSKSTGQIGLDSYTTNVFGIRTNNDFHGKVCINADTTYAPTNGVC
jgi:hypothetical protein